jgi:dihydrofolate reductase
MIIGVVCVDQCHGIGKNGSIPWHCKEDMRHFKKLTVGGRVVMGRKTWESLPKRPLLNRDNFILTKQQNYVAEGAKVINEPIIDGDLFVIGGAEIYELYSPYIDMWCISQIKAKHDCDTFLSRCLLYGYECISEEPLSNYCVVSRYIR